MSRLPASAELTLFGLIISMAIAIPLGILAAVKQGSWIDHTCRVVATAGVSLPVFFTGLLLVYVFYFRLGWAPAPLGRLDVFYDAPPQVTGFYLIDSLIAGEPEIFVASLKQLILPGLTLGDFLAGSDRANDARLDACSAVVGFRAYRARQRAVRSYTVIITYAFRNAMLPLITTLGMVFSFLLGANVLVEKVFAWPGIGSFAVEALIASDFAPGSGLRADHGGHVRGAQSLDRSPLRRRRPAREARSMTDHRGSSPFGERFFAQLRHSRYVIAENPVTGLAFGLFVLIVVSAMVGPWIVPYDPLASNTAVALQAA